ncbi:MAG: T9SS type A sorting domain-containing protein [Bacteroidales bacterium]
MIRILSPIRTFPIRFSMKNNPVKALFTLLFLLTAISIFGQIQLIPLTGVPVIHAGDTLKNPWAGGFNSPQFSAIDLNSNGIKDLVAFERNFYGVIKTFINEGIPGEVSYRFEPEFRWFFPRIQNWALLVDYDGDGKEDLFTSVPAGIAVYKSTGDDTGPKFSLITSLLQTQGLNGPTNLYVPPPDIPAIADIDNDGDMDILTFDISGSTVEYHKNLSVENHGNPGQLEFELKNACWGYFSEGATTNTIHLYDTCDVNVEDPEKSGKHPGSTLLALDMNGNGVKDLLLGDLTYPNMTLLMNGGTTTAAIMVSTDTQFPSNSLPVDLTLFPAAYLVDVNNDGLDDLIIAPNNPNTSENHDHILYYRNTGTADVPEFTYQQKGFLQEGMIDVGEGAFAVFFDEDADGLMDIIVGNFGYFSGPSDYTSRLALLRNTGTAEKPAFDLVTSDYTALSVFGFKGIYPAFGDMDGDGDLDMLIGDEEGKLHYFRNDDGAGNPTQFTLAGPDYMGIDAGVSARPQIIDVNRDGLPDILVGERSGTIRYYENTGTPGNPNFSSVPSNELFGGIDVMPECCTGYSAPFMTEDSTGAYMLYVGSEQGMLYLYNNIDGNLNGSFNLVDSVYICGLNVNVSGADITNNGRLEFVYGEYAGGIGLLQKGSPQGIGINNTRYTGLQFSIYPNPSGDFVNIIFPAGNPGDHFLLQVYNLFGQLLLSQSFPNSTGNETLNLSGLASGLYLLRIKSSTGTATARVVKR